MNARPPYWVTRVVSESENTVKVIEHFPGMEPIEFPEMSRPLAQMLLAERQSRVNKMTKEVYEKLLADTAQTFVKHDHDPSKPCNCGAK